MKDQVLNFFKDLPQTPQEQFNKALELYRKSKESSFVQVRFFNAAGFTKPNLANLLYELKKIHRITDGQIRMAKVESKKEEGKSENKDSFAIPVWEKGSKGNQARKVFCAEHGIEVEKFTNKVMDAAIAEWVKKAEVEREKGEEEPETTNPELASGGAGPETGAPFDEPNTFNIEIEKKNGEEPS